MLLAGYLYIFCTDVTLLRRYFGGFVQIAHRQNGRQFDF